MGVTGLWKLIEQSGKPVPLEMLENKVLAIDISIWLHQVTKGFHDAKGNPLKNAHIMGLFNRLCKLLFYRIKPVFIFDGGVPDLKKSTIARRQQSKSKQQKEADRLQQVILQYMAKEDIVKEALGDSVGLLQGISPVKLKRSAIADRDEELYKLPEIDSFPQQSLPEDEDDEDIDSEYRASTLHSIDVNSKYFKSLPADIRLKILDELKETRKQSSWNRLHELPAQSDDFAQFQLNRLLRRRQVQVSYEEAEAEMGGKSLSLVELETLLTQDGVVETLDSKQFQRVASSSDTKLLYIRDVQKSMDDARNAPSTSKAAATTTENETQEDIDLQRAIELSLTADTTPSSSEGGSSVHLKLTDHQRKNLRHTGKASARDFMTEYAVLTTDEIHDLLATQKENRKMDSLINETLLASPKPEKKEAEEEQDEVVSVSSSTDSDLIDVPGVEELNESFTVVESDEYPLQQGEPAKDFRIEDLQIVKITKVDTPPEDDIFADVFAAPKANKESEVVVNISSQESEGVHAAEPKNETQKSEGDLIRIQTPPAQLAEVEPTAKESVEKTPEKPTFMVHLESPSGGSSKQLVFTTPPKKKQEEEPSNEPPTPEMPKPFFSPKKKDSPHKTPEAAVSPKAAKALFPPDPPASTSAEPPPLLQTRESIVKELKQTVTADDLRQMASDLSRERTSLVTEMGKHDRFGLSITQQMQADCQKLLRLFGVPFIIAPMEAEAQCAFLNSVGLIDGIITDDSDVWLFGGQTVYKNFFDQRKTVLEYRAENIERLLKMSRRQLIQLAMLVGSDYTLGITGVGTVTALEILAAFTMTEEAPGEVTDIMSVLSSLRRFKEWWMSGKTANNSDRMALKAKLRSLHLHEGFPSSGVVEAYLHPTVDDSLEPFSWGEPNVEEIREFARTTLGWTYKKTDDTLEPVLKRINEKSAQKSIRSYFSTLSSITRKEITVSKRTSKAIKRLAGETVEEKPAPAAKKRPKKSENEKKPAKADPQPGSSKEKAPKQPRKRKAPAVPTPIFDEDNLESVSPPKIARKPIIPDRKRPIPQRVKDVEEMEDKKKRAAEILKKKQSGNKK